MIGLVNICPHSELLQCYWPYSLCYMLHHLQLIYFITGDLLPFTNFILPLVPFPLARKNRILCIYESVFIFPLCILLEDNCFTLLCGPLPYINMNQPQVYICPFPLEPPSTLPPHPIPSHPIPPNPVLSAATEHWVCPVPYSKFPQAVCFTYGNVHVSVLFSLFIPPLPSPAATYHFKIFPI